MKSRKPAAVPATSRSAVPHSHVHTHPSVTHTHRLDVLQEFAWHHLLPHQHAHEDEAGRDAEAEAERVEPDREEGPRQGDQARPAQRRDGEHEAGGTSWMYISDVPLESLGLKAGLRTAPYPELTATALSVVPVVMTLWPPLLMGLYTFTHRRETVAAAEHRHEAGAPIEGDDHA